MIETEHIRQDLTFVPVPALYQVYESTGGFASLEQVSITVHPSARGPDVPSVASVNLGPSVSGKGDGQSYHAFIMQFLSMQTGVRCHSDM